MATPKRKPPKRLPSRSAPISPSVSRSAVSPVSPQGTHSRDRRQAQEGQTQAAPADAASRPVSGGRAPRGDAQRIARGRVARGERRASVKIASTLGFPSATFKKRLQANEHDNPLRLSWEKGRSDLEYEVATLLLDQARNGNAISAIFYGKSQLNWQDTPQPTQQVGIQIVVPDSLSREAFAARQLPQVTVIEAPKPPVMEKYVPDPEPEPIFTPAGYEQ